MSIQIIDVGSSIKVVKGNAVYVLDKDELKIQKTGDDEIRIVDAQMTPYDLNYSEITTPVSSDIDDLIFQVEEMKETTAELIKLNDIINRAESIIAKADTIINRLEVSNYLDFGGADNLPFALNSVLEVDNGFGYSTIAFRAVAPTGGTIAFEGTFDGINWVAITLRSVGVDGYTQIGTGTEHYIGSISGLRKFRVRTSIAGSANGTISGRLQRDASTLEGQEHSAPPNKIGFGIVSKDFTFTAAQTGTPIWTPATGKRFVVTDIIITTQGVATNIRIFDGTDAAGNLVFLSRAASNSTITHSYSVGRPSASVNNSLKITTDTVADVRGVVIGYETN